MRILINPLSFITSLYAQGPEQVPFVDEDESIPLIADKEFNYGVDHLINNKWQRRGEMHVQLQQGSYSVRFSDSPQFSAKDLKDKFKSSTSKSFYKMRLINSKDVPFELHASIPTQLVTNSEDKHDMFELALSPSGLPVGFNYRVYETLGLHLFEHTSVHISEPHYAIEPHITPRKEEEKAKQQEASQGSINGFLSKYWWVILIGLVLVLAGGGGEDKGGGGGG